MNPRGGFLKVYNSMKQSLPLKNGLVLLCTLMALLCYRTSLQANVQKQ